MTDTPLHAVPDGGGEDLPLHRPAHLSSDLVVNIAMDTMPTLLKAMLAVKVELKRVGDRIKAADEDSWDAEEQNALAKVLIPFISPMVRIDHEVARLGSRIHAMTEADLPARVYNEMHDGWLEIEATLSTYTKTGELG